MSPEELKAHARRLPDELLTQGDLAVADRVVQRLTLSGTHRGEYCGLPPTGRCATWQLVAIQRIGPDGKVAEHWSSPDLFGLLLQLGALPAADLAVGPGPVAGSSE